MTTSTPGEHNIDSLADRAKEMLERVRGSADADASTTATSDVPDDAAETTDVPSTDAVDVDTVEAEALEADVDTTTEPADPDEVEETPADQDLDDLDVDALFQPQETTGADDISAADDSDADATDVTEDVADADDAGTTDEEHVEPVDESVELDDVDEVEEAEDADDSTDIDDDPNFADDDAAAANADEEEASDIEPESDSVDGASRLSMLASQAKESLDSVAGTATATSANVDDLAADTIDLSADLDEDAPTIELPESPLGDSSAKELGDDIVDDLAASDDSGVGLFGDVDESDAPTIDVDDLSPADSSGIDTVEIDLIDEADEDADGAVVSGTAIVAGTAAAAMGIGALSADEATDAVVQDVENIDLETTEASDVLPTKDPGSGVEPELRKLVVEPEPEDERVRAFSWLVPLAFLAIAVLALVWWVSGRDTNEPSSTTTPDQTQVDETDGGETNPDDTPDTTAAPDTTTTTTETTTTESTTTTTTIPAAAWALLGEDSNTALFAALGGPIGLQAALEQDVDADGNPLEFTLLAPSDAAISALTDDQLTELAEDPAQTAALIDYHFIDQKLTPELLAEAAGGELTTRAGLPLMVELDGDDVVLNGTTRISLDSFEAENGNVLVVDGVLSPPSINAALDLGNIQFEVISSVITQAGKDELQKAVTFFNANPDANALIEGHTDTDGEAEANLRLSDRRARAVRDFLISQGIDGSRLVAEGFGETQPIIENGVENKDASRRIEFILR